MMQRSAAVWYWIVAGDKTQAWSAAAGGFVPTTDATFIAWKSTGGVPDTIGSLADLADVLQTQVPNLTVNDATVSDAMKTAQARAIVLMPIFKVLFNHENRIRAIERNLTLNGSPAALTVLQAVAAVKALL
jgi:hypothetical protein